jgi:hypothetical protein
MKPTKAQPAPINEDHDVGSGLVNEVARNDWGRSANQLRKSIHKPADRTTRRCWKHHCRERPCKDPHVHEKREHQRECEYKLPGHRLPEHRENYESYTSDRSHEERARDGSNVTDPIRKESADRLAYEGRCRCGYCPQETGGPHIYPVHRVQRLIGSIRRRWPRSRGAT